MAHIIINPSLSAAIGYNLFLNLPKFAEVSTILEPANSTGTDYSISIKACTSAGALHHTFYPSCRADVNISNYILCLL